MPLLKTTDADARLNAALGALRAAAALTRAPNAQQKAQWEALANDLTAVRGHVSALRSCKDS